MRCLTSTRFNMRVDVLKQGIGGPTPVTDPDTDVAGAWVEQQDPLTHEIVRVWVPSEIVPDNPDTPDVDETTFYQIPAMVRGIIDGGIRVAGTTERWGELYENVDYARMWFPANYILTKRDRVTNIRGSNGQIVWRDEEVNPLVAGDYRATVFDVLGVTPILDPFGKHIENVAMLQKVEVHG